MLRSPRNRRLSLLLLTPVLLLIGASRPGRAARSPSAALKASARHLQGTASFPSSPRDRRPDHADRSQAPFLYVAGKDPSTDRLPLKETRAEVRIAGVIAQVTVHQVFENDGEAAIEAVYVFPGSTRAAVHGMRMRIGDRTVVAKIEKKAKARATYEAAKAAGKRASLLEQNRPNVFTMNVANIMPGDRIEVTLDYSELLVPEEGVYEFVYPTVVGPRFTGESKGDTAFAANPHLTPGAPAPYRFDLQVHLDAGLPIERVESPSHEIRVRRPSPESAEIDLAKSGGGNKDFVLRYTLAGKEIQTGLLLYEDGKQSYFLLMLEPPERPRPKAIPPREYVFLLDVSGSMHGYPLNTAKKLMKNLLGQLRVEDTFNVEFFSGSSWVLSPEGSLPATDGNIALALDRIDRMQGGGGTRLLDGLRAAYALPRSAQGLSRTVIVVTDGYVSVEAQAFRWIREHLNEANVYAFGIGRSVNRALIEGMARAGQGEPFVVFDEKSAMAAAERLGEYIREPVLSQITYRFEGFHAREVAPMRLPDLMARRPLILFGKYRGAARGRIVVEGFTGEGKRTFTVNVADHRPDSRFAAIRTLWARKWVSILSDELVMARGAKELEDAITDLGLSYDLLTRFTSFVAVDSEVANETGKTQTVRQALPMPEGVSPMAVGAAGMVKTKSLGSFSTRSAAPALPAAMMAPPRAPRRMRRRMGRGGARAVAADEAAAAAPRLVVTRAQAKKIPNARPVVAALEKLLAGARCGQAKGRVRLRLVFGPGGRIRAVKVTSGSAALGRCVRRLLEGKTIDAAVPAGASLTLDLRTL